MRDMILVERVTDGERCGGECQHVEYEFSTCTAFDEPRHIAQFVDGDKSASFKRCKTCLATPSAVVLTAEMEEAVKRAAVFIKHYGCQDDYHALRAAFQNIVGVGR